MSEPTQGEDLVFICPEHGESEAIFMSAIPGHEGVWCAACYFEMLEEYGVCRMEPIPLGATGRH